ncbi:hypothetical protein BKA64DRAFT_753782 [Cadophora sp. MPI-SDFR-AT-0126]|nr:hypothetical protein BKA64DRAFT_753782 [Leotiomycetes sp. MPI-SDFR-AT-0126]
MAEQNNLPLLITNISILAISNLKRNAATPTIHSVATNSDVEKNTPTPATYRRRPLAGAFQSLIPFFTVCLIANYCLVCAIEYLNSGHVSWVIYAWTYLGIWAFAMIKVSIILLATHYKLSEKVKIWWRKGKDDANQDLKTGEIEKEEVVEQVEVEKVKNNLGDVKESNET